MTRTTLTHWTLAATLAAFASLAAAQAAGGDSSGGNAGPKSPPAKTSDGASQPGDSHMNKDKRKAKGAANAASGAEHANPLGSTKKTDASKGPN